MCGERSTLVILSTLLLLLVCRHAVNAYDHFSTDQHYISGDRPRSAHSPYSLFHGGGSASIAALAKKRKTCYGRGNCPDFHMCLMYECVPL